MLANAWIIWTVPINMLLCLTIIGTKCYCIILCLLLWWIRNYTENFSNNCACLFADIAGLNINAVCTI